MYIIQMNLWNRMLWLLFNWFVVIKSVSVQFLRKEEILILVSAVSFHGRTSRRVALRVWEICYRTVSEKQTQDVSNTVFRVQL